ncbi:hypothetical protein D3C75_1262330 [compost metagenome]
MLSPADPSAQLMQLRQAEAVGIHNDHQCRIRNIDTDLHNRRRDKQLQFIAVEGPHHLILL